MNVSPVGGGTITSPDFSTPKVVIDSEEYTCSTSYKLTAVPETSKKYVFDRWEGSINGSTNPITISVAEGSKSVTAYFVFKTEPISLQDAKDDLLDEDKDVLVIDVSSAINFAAGHLLCAKNYMWNSGGNNFFTSITSLTPYKKDTILIYDQDGSKSQAAAKYLAEQGFEAVSYMTDGFSEWEEAGLEDAGYEIFITGNYPGGDNDVCTSLAPLAYAGVDQSVNENQKVTLNGSSGSGVTYEWRQAEGNNNVVLSGSSSPSPTFTAPDLVGGDDKLIFHLTVTDGSGNTDTDSVAVDVKWINAAPNAYAGTDQIVMEGDTVSLNGSATDSDGTIVSYEWSQTGTPKVTLSNPAIAKPTFTAPNVSASTVLTFTLTVTDNNGALDSDSVTVTVNDGDNGPEPNVAPVANAGADQTVTEGAAVILDSNSSTDSDGSIVSRTWAQTGGSPAVTLSNPAAIRPTFTAPDVSASTVLTFTLTVTDDDDASHSDTVKVTVNDDSTPPPPENKPPTADAGKDISVKAGGTVVLDSSASSDSDGTIASRAWTQTGGTPVVTLSNPGAIKPTFTAPDVDSATLLTFSLVVTDDDGAASTADTVNVTITKASSGGGGGGGCFIDSLNE